MNKPLVSYLLLDFLRPNESKKCIESLHQYTKFPFQIIYLSNGPDYQNQEYVLDYYKRGLIDKLILNKQNNGLGYGTTDLFRFCDTGYSIYVQSDQFLYRDFTLEELDKLFALFNSVTQIMSISLAGDACQGKYSERAHIINTFFYNCILEKPNGGAGPFHDKPWNEGYLQQYYKNNNLIHYIYEKPLFIDNGCYAIRENPDGTVWRHRTDSKQLELVSGEPKERFIYPYFNDKEWNYVLKYKTWPRWRIPLRELQSAFLYFKGTELGIQQYIPELD